jgi:hypothetical protein
MSAPPSHTGMKKGLTERRSRGQSVRTFQLELHGQRARVRELGSIPFESRLLTAVLATLIFDFMSAIHRAINLVVALTLVVLGCGGFVYFYFIATTWNRGLAIAAGIVALAGLYWLWDEHINLGEESQN